MKKYISLLIFYVSSFLIIYLLNKFSPNGHDGGFGFGSLAIVLLILTVIVLLCLSVYKGFKTDKGYLMIAAIHFGVLMAGIFELFL